MGEGHLFPFPSLMHANVLITERKGKGKEENRNETVFLKGKVFTRIRYYTGREAKLVFSAQKEDEVAAAAALPLRSRAKRNPPSHNFSFSIIPLQASRPPTPPPSPGLPGTIRTLGFSFPNPRSHGKENLFFLLASFSFLSAKRISPSNPFPGSGFGRNGKRREEKTFTFLFFCST